MKKVIILSTALCLFLKIHAQSVTLKGKVTDKNKNPLENVQIKLYSDTFNLTSKTDSKGSYTLENIPLGEYKVRAEKERYKTVTKSISFKTYKTYSLEYLLKFNAMYNKIDEVVVTGSRERINRKKSPILVNIIGRQTFDQVQAVSLGEGISFQPGLRYEDNCQNCGFNQLRMNGLGGGYSQILIDSRPIFSALAGIYGLDQIPSVMVDRIEVVSGGGSSLHGGNAIAGTVNIITRDPVINGFQLKTNTALLDGERPDNTVSFAASVANDDNTLGSYFFGNFRRRNWWDANGDSDNINDDEDGVGGDEYSEIPKITNNSFGFKSYYKPGDRSKVKLEGHFINEFRRGGDKFDFPAHQTTITEQLDHNIYGGQLSYELASKNHMNNYSAYISGQVVNRKSYYGGGGYDAFFGGRDDVKETEDIQTFFDDLDATDAYGMTDDVSIIGGVQWNKKFALGAALVSGVETKYEKVEDEMPQYGRLTDQKVYTTGMYSQFTFHPIENLTTSLGARLDVINIDGLYTLDDENKKTDYSKGVFNPRVNLLYSISDHWRLRTSYARGFRAPQAFDEDLHVEQVGGTQSFIMLGSDLKPETSDAFTASINWDHITPNSYMEVLLEGFYTKINDAFVNEAIDNTEKYQLVEKRNGSGSYVSGINLRIDNSFYSKFQTQLGFTLQTARYDEPEEILEAPDDFQLIGSSSTKKILRTPNLYGYFTANYKASGHIDIDLSGAYTGSMVVPYAGGGHFELKGGNPGDAGFFDSPEFFELNTKIDYHFRLKGDYSMSLIGGIQNIFNSYQKDWDYGPDRDSAFIYGPSRPRTFFIGIEIGNL